jgi:sialate O-acetylesterase
MMARKDFRTQVARSSLLRAGHRLLAFAALTSAAVQGAELRLAAVFGNHMVLQRDQAVPVWGRAVAGDEVRVTFAGQEHTATTDTEGRWLVRLNAMPASETPRELVVACIEEKIVCNDVLVGEVWCASGQSNMGWNLAKTSGGEETAAAADDPLLRLARVAGQIAPEPVDDLAKCTWARCTPEMAAHASAVAFHFGHELRRSLKVPVGVLTSAYPASTCQAWIPSAALAADPVLANYLTEWDRRIAAYDSALAKPPDAKAPANAEPPRDPRQVQMRPAVLFNGMIRPLVPFAIRGVIWYQAEGNNGDPNLERCFTTLVTSWRDAWQQSRLPFLFVQLPRYGGFRPETRDAQARCAQSVPETAMVVTIDLGDPDDIHPRDKEPVGIRLALKARGLVYGEDVVHSGPELEEIRRDAAALVVSFNHADGLSARGGPVSGFEIAGDDGMFHPATAVIESGAVRLQADTVPAPTRARYAWAGVPDANLFNAAGLPAAPFPATAVAAAFPKAATLVPMTDAAVRAGLSPLNWVTTGTAASTTVCGASVRVGFRDTTTVSLQVDTSVIALPDASRFPILSWTVNGGPPQSHQLVAGDRSIMLSRDVADPVIDLCVKGMCPWINRYEGDPPPNAFTLTGFVIDDGGTSVVAEQPAGIWLAIGDSITSGDAAAYAEKQGRPPKAAWAASDDARASYARLLAEHFGYRESRLAYGGYNWKGGLAKLPGLTTLIDQKTSTVSRLEEGLLDPPPDIVSVNLGTNGRPSVEEVAAALTALRKRAGPKATLIVMVPFNGAARAEVTAGFQAYVQASSDERAHLVDVGTFSFATADGVHPTAAGHRTIFERLVPALEPLVARARSGRQPAGPP